MTKVEKTRLDDLVEKFQLLALELVAAKSQMEDEYTINLRDMYIIIDLARAIKDRELVAARNALDLISQLREEVADLRLRTQHNPW